MFVCLRAGMSTVEVMLQVCNYNLKASLVIDGPVSTCLVIFKNTEMYRDT